MFRRIEILLQEWRFGIVSGNPWSFILLILVLIVLGGIFILAGSFIWVTLGTIAIAFAIVNLAARIRPMHGGRTGKLIAILMGAYAGGLLPLLVVRYVFSIDYNTIGNISQILLLIVIVVCMILGSYLASRNVRVV
jgi:hypothetical protein